MSHARAERLRGEQGTWKWRLEEMVAERASHEQELEQLLSEMDRARIRGGIDSSFGDVVGVVPSASSAACGSSENHAQAAMGGTLCNFAQRRLLEQP